MSTRLKILELFFKLCLIGRTRNKVSRTKQRIDVSFSTLKNKSSARGNHLTTIFGLQEIGIKEAFLNSVNHNTTGEKLRRKLTTSWNIVRQFKISLYILLIQYPKEIMLGVYGVWYVCLIMLFTA